ncbi:hypothetical protein Tco_0875246 [Tanacetum coccineum]|uniref:Uncharacterized protein n=1 Tax=Tanacetum coccineum TaxID=301880 RepID=A0ABQ5BNX2_9ASTR
MVYVVDGVLVRGVDIILEVDFVRFATQKPEIHSFMIQSRILSIILLIFLTNHHSTMSRHTRASYVGTILIMVMIVHHDSRLSMSRNRATIKTLKITKEKELRQQEQAANLSTHTLEPSQRFNSIYYDDDDDEESTIPLNEIISRLPPSIAITSVLPAMEPEDTLNMGDEYLSTIPEK